MISAFRDEMAAIDSCYKFKQLQLTLESNNSEPVPADDLTYINPSRTDTSVDDCKSNETFKPVKKTQDPELVKILTYLIQHE